MTVKTLERYLLGAVLVVMAFAMLSCGDEASQAEELCKGGCTVYQDCAEELFNEEFRDLAERIESCHEDWQCNYDHDLAIDIEAHGPGAKRCFDLEIELRPTRVVWKITREPKAYGITQARRGFDDAVRYRGISAMKIGKRVNSRTLSPRSVGFFSSQRRDL